MAKGNEGEEIRGSRVSKAPRIKYVDGIPVFDLAESEVEITSEQVKALEEEE